MLAERYLQDVAVRLTQNAVRRDRASTARAIGPIGLDGELPLLSRAHVKQTLVPALDDLALADGEAQGLAAAVGSVEFGTVRQSSAVVNIDLVASLRLASTLGRSEDLGLEVLSTRLACCGPHMCLWFADLIVDDVGHGGRSQCDEQCDLHV